VRLNEQLALGDGAVKPQYPGPAGGTFQRGRRTCPAAFVHPWAWVAVTRMTVALIFPALLELQRAGIPALGFNPDDGQKALSENRMISELVAEVIGLPTINGISIFNPPLWPDGLPSTPAYAAAVRA